MITSTAVTDPASQPILFKGNRSNFERNRMRLADLRRLFLVGFGLVGFTAAATAQCSDGTTTTIEARNVLRTGGNQVYTFAQSVVTGDYAYTWSTYVSATSYMNGTQTHSGSASKSMGQLASVGWYDTPSTLGPGTYSESSYHSFTNTCGGSASYNYSPSLSVNRPTISGVNSGLWYFGPGSSLTISSSGSTYYQYAPLSFNTNCNAGDSCSDTPQWNDVTSSNQTYLSGNTGTSVSIYSGPGTGNCAYDSSLSANIGGFTSSSYPILVNSPTSLVSQAAYNNTSSYGSGGYLSQVYWSVADACSPANAVLSVPQHEEFGSFYNPGVVSGWPDPSPTGAANFDYTAYIWYDQIAAGVNTWNPVPTYTASNPPFSYNTVLKDATHTWYMGTSSPTSGGGLLVFLGTISYYQDHGTSQ